MELGESDAEDVGDLGRLRTDVRGPGAGRNSSHVNPELNLQGEGGQWGGIEHPDFNHNHSAGPGEEARRGGASDNTSNKARILQQQVHLPLRTFLYFFSTL